MSPNPMKRNRGNTTTNRGKGPTPGKSYTWPNQVGTIHRAITAPKELFQALRLGKAAKAAFYTLALSLIDENNKTLDNNTISQL